MPAVTRAVSAAKSLKSPTPAPSSGGGSSPAPPSGGGRSMPKLKAPSVPSDTGSLAVNVGLLSVGALLVYAGFKGMSIIDVFSGKSPSQTGSNAPEEKKATEVPKQTPSQVSADNKGRARSGTRMTASTPGTTIMDGKPVANWIYSILQWARKNGWNGRVNSGYRTAAEQTRAATGYGLQNYGSGGPQASNHRGKAWPKGAVDVTEPEKLNEVLKKYPGFPTLKWGGPVMNDPVHFSYTGR